MEKISEKRIEVLQMIVEEIDAAREVYQLFLQLEKALPIKSFEDIAKAADKEGILHFRDASTSFKFFESYVPSFIFPIENAKALIERLAQFVKLVPEDVGYDPSKPENLKRVNQARFLNSLVTKSNAGSFAGVSTAGFTDPKGLQHMVADRQEKK